MTYFVSCDFDEDWLQFTRFYIAHRRRISDENSGFFDCMNRIFVYRENGGVLFGRNADGAIIGMFGYLYAVPDKELAPDTVFIDSCLILEEYNYPGLLLLGFQALVTKLQCTAPHIEKVCFQAHMGNAYLHRLYSKFMTRTGADETGTCFVYVATLSELTNRLKKILQRRSRHS